MTKHGKKKLGKQPKVKSNRPINKGVNILGKNVGVNSGPVTEGVKIVGRD